MTRVFSGFIQNLPANERSTIVNTKHRKSPVIVQKEASHSLFLICILDRIANISFCIQTEDLRQKQALESEQEKEEKRKKKEEEKKKRDEEKRLHEEEKRLRDEEKKAIEEEKKRQREEEKRLREEEKRLRDEEKKRKEDEKKKKEQVTLLYQLLQVSEYKPEHYLIIQSQLRLTSLFTKSSHVEATPLVEKLLEPAKPTLFPAFYIKDHVTISNINHQSNNTTSSSYQDFRNAINTKTVSINNFLSEINHDSKQKRGVSTHVDIRTLLLPGSADILLVPNVRLVLRMKLLQFTENVRPAYYGSWTQKSHKITGKTPFAKDQDKLDYDHDSEAEWEPEGEGEDIVSGDEDDDDPNTDMIDPEDVCFAFSLFGY